MHILCGLIGSLGLFLYGMQLTSESLQLVTNYKFRNALGTLTRNRIVALLFGFVITVILNSSGAAIIMLVGLVSASLMTVGQAVGVLLGSGVGTAVTVQLLAFNIADYALLLIGLAAFMMIIGNKNNKLIHTGRVLLGIGFLFYGLKLMAETVSPLRNSPYFHDLFVGFGKNPLLGILVSAVFSGLIHSSAATIGLLISLATQGMITIETAMPLILGANIGTACATGALSWIGTSREAKRVAVINILTKVIGTLLLLPFIHGFSTAVRVTSDSVARQIANAHTFFNILLILLFLPFTNQLALFGKLLVPDGKKRLPVLETAKYLNESFLEIPEIAVNQAKLQTVEMGRIAREEMLKHLLYAFRAYKKEAIEGIKKAEVALDSIYQKICAYVAKIRRHTLPEDLAERTIQILYTANDLEHIGDFLINVINLARKFTQGRMEFSGEGVQELELMYEKADTSLALALQAFADSNRELATQVIKEHPKLLRLENKLRYKHFERIREGNERTLATSAIHLDLIESFRRVENHAMNIAYTVLGMG